MGRPSKYKPEFCQELEDFFNVEPYEDVKLPHYNNGQVKWEDIKRLPNKLPTLVQFAKSVKVGIRTVYDWIDEKHSSYQKEFSQTFTHVAKRLQKDFIIQNGLQGLYNPAFAKFTAINITDMVDQLPTIDNSKHTHYHLVGQLHDLIRGNGVHKEEKKEDGGNGKHPRVDERSSLSIIE